MENRTEELRERALDLIADTLSEAVAIGSEPNWDCRYKAGWLLERLEPVIFQYAPPPAQIVEALRHGNQRPGGEFVYDMDQARP